MQKKRGNRLYHILLYLPLHNLPHLHHKGAEEEQQEGDVQGGRRPNPQNFPSGFTMLGGVRPWRSKYALTGPDYRLTRITEKSY